MTYFVISGRSYSCNLPRCTIDTKTTRRIATDITRRTWSVRIRRVIKFQFSAFGDAKKYGNLIQNRSRDRASTNSEIIFVTPCNVGTTWFFDPTTAYETNYGPGCVQPSGLTGSNDLYLVLFGFGTLCHKLQWMRRQWNVSNGISRTTQRKEHVKRREIGRRCTT